MVVNDRNFSGGETTINIYDSNVLNSVLLGRWIESNVL